jgi:hypothetical protein
MDSVHPREPQIRAQSDAESDNSGNGGSSPLGNYSDTSRDEQPSSPEDELCIFKQLKQQLETQQRGKGHHMCPLGQSCRKGGWKDGEAVVFERNSAFK